MKPGDFYVGVISFFAILVPGAIGVAVLRPLTAAKLGEPITIPNDLTARWVAFLVAAYFLGHLIFLIGAWLDGPYNKIRKLLNPYGNESAYQRALDIQKRIVKDSELNAINTFQWSRAILTLFYPSAASDVHLLEADSKFFRSLLIVLVLCAIVFFYQGKSAEGLISLILLVPCAMRYYERRLKSTTQAYMYMIALYRAGMGKGLPLAAGASQSEPTT